MKALSFSLIGSLALSLTSCSEFYEVYIRNTTTQLAVLDIYLHEKSGLKVLPNRVKVASRPVEFKVKVGKYVDSSQAVTWVDANHFKIEVQPSTTIDLTEMEHLFKQNSYQLPYTSITVTLTANNKIDTLMNKSDFFLRYEKFKSVIHGPFSPSYFYYDVEREALRTAILND